MYEKIKTFFPRTVDLVVFAILVFLLLCGSCIGIGALYYHRSGTNPVGKQLEQIEHTQSSITSEIRESREELGGVADKMQATEREISSVRNELQDSRTLIEDSQRILETVRNRGKSKTTQTP